MLELLKAEANKGYTENGAATYLSSGSDCLDLFAVLGALRGADEAKVASLIRRALAEDSRLTIRMIFYARDVRGGLGERRFFRIALRFLAQEAPELVEKNLPYVAEFGRYDDLFSLWDTPGEGAMLDWVKAQLQADWAARQAQKPVSLLAKWLPSVNASCALTRYMGKRFAKALGLREQQYRRMLTILRQDSGILENYLRRKDYTFAYDKQPAKAMFKYRAAFWREDGERYGQYLKQVQSGQATLKTGTLYPYEIIRPCLNRTLTEQQRQSLQATWQALPDYTNADNALVVMDGSGSMYGWDNGQPALTALSLAIYFAERNQGRFHNHFITFSENPQLVEIKGRDITERVQYCSAFNEARNTNLQAVFALLLQTARRHKLPQKDLPQMLYMISDMEFDRCTVNSSLTNFQAARQAFAQAGYKLPQVVFWNVASHQRQQPVTQNAQGVLLLSGSSPQVFELLASGETSPYAYMLRVLNAPRYAVIDT